MRRSLKIIGIIIAVLVVIVIAVPFVLNANDFRPRIESDLSAALGRRVTVGNLKLSVLTGSVAADDLSISDDPGFSNNPFIRAKGLDVGVEMIPLIFHKSLQITNISIDQPEVVLLRSPSGKWNFSTLGSKTAKSSETSNPNLAVGKLTVRNGSLSSGDTNSSKRTQYKDVDISVQNFSLASQFPFTLSATLPGGGTLKLDGKAGPINSTDASLTSVQAQIVVKKLDLAASGFLPATAAMSGQADFEGTFSSDGRELQSSGTVEASNLKLSPKGRAVARPVTLKYAATYALQPQTGQLTTGNISFGKALARLTGSFDMRGDSTVLNMKLNADGMPINDLEALLPALGVMLPQGSSLQGGTLSSDLSISGPVDKLVIAGPVRASNTKLAGFNLGSQLSEVAKLSGAPQGQDTVIQNFSADLRVSPSGTTTQNVNLNVPSFGVITGGGSISPSDALNYKMNANLSGTLVTGLTQLAGLGNKGANLPFAIVGTSSNPRFIPDMQALLSSQLKSRLGGQSIGGQDAGSVVNAITGLFGKKKNQ